MVALSFVKEGYFLRYYFWLDLRLPPPAMAALRRAGQRLPRAAGGRRDTVVPDLPAGDARQVQPGLRPVARTIACGYGKLETQLDLAFVGAGFLAWSDCSRRILHGTRITGRHCRRQQLPLEFPEAQIRVAHQWKASGIPLEDLHGHAAIGFLETA